MHGTRLKKKTFLGRFRRNGLEIVHSRGGVGRVIEVLRFSQCQCVSEVKGRSWLKSRLVR